MPDRTGCIREDQVREAVTEQTILVSMMAVNNEVGTVLPVDAAVEAIAASRAPALLHVDAVQAYGKLPLNPARRGIDLMTVSAHKIHGPKGAGALYIAGGTLFGGAVLRRRAGSGISARAQEPVPAIAGMGAAVEAAPAGGILQACNPAEGPAGGTAEPMPEVIVHRRRLRGCGTLYSEFVGPRRAGRDHASFLAEQGDLCFLRLSLRQGSAKPCAYGDGAGEKGDWVGPTGQLSWDNTMDEVELFARALREGLDTLARSR